MLYMGVIAQRYSNQYLREENAFVHRLDLITFLLMIINFALIIVKIETPKSFSTVLIIFTVLVSYYILNI